MPSGLPLHIFPLYRNHFWKLLGEEKIGGEVKTGITENSNLGVTDCKSLSLAKEEIR